LKEREKLLKWCFGLSKNEVLEAIGPYVNENSIRTPFRRVPDDGLFIS